MQSQNSNHSQTQSGKTTPDSRPPPSLLQFQSPFQTSNLSGHQDTNVSKQSNGDSITSKSKIQTQFVSPGNMTLNQQDMQKDMHFDFSNDTNLTKIPSKNPFDRQNFPSKNLVHDFYQTTTSNVQLYNANSIDDREATALSNKQHMGFETSERDQMKTENQRNLTNSQNQRIASPSPQFNQQASSAKKPQFKFVIQGSPTQKNSLACKNLALHSNHSQMRSQFSAQVNKAHNAHNDVQYNQEDISLQERSSHTIQNQRLQKSEELMLLSQHHKQKEELLQKRLNLVDLYDEYIDDKKSQAILNSQQVETMNAQGKSAKDLKFNHQRPLNESKEHLKSSKNVKGHRFSEQLQFDNEEFQSTDEVVNLNQDSDQNIQTVIQNLLHDMQPSNSITNQSFSPHSQQNVLSQRNNLASTQHQTFIKSQALDIVEEELMSDSSSNRISLNLDSRSSTSTVNSLSERNGKSQQSSSSSSTDQSKVNILVTTHPTKETRNDSNRLRVIHQDKISKKDAASLNSQSSKKRKIDEVSNCSGENHYEELDKAVNDFKRLKLSPSLTDNISQSINQEIMTIQPQSPFVQIKDVIQM
eukprot:403359756